MKVDELLSFLKTTESNLNNSYWKGNINLIQSEGVREIPKETKGEFRKLGVPTVVDRVFQQGNYTGTFSYLRGAVFRKQFWLSSM